MSTSPEKDLHSVYIDGEMPENFISQYEAAVNADESAKAVLDRMKALHDILQEDAKSKTTDKAFMDASFERLQSRMSYSRTISVNKKSYILPIAKYASSFAAAAAVFAVIFIPVHNKALSSVKSAEVAAIEITKEGMKPISEKQVVIDGNLHTENLSQGIAVKPKTETLKPDQKAEIKTTVEEAAERPAVEQKTVRASALVSNGHTARNFNLPSVDPFRPDFSSSSMKLSVPKFDEMRNNFKTDSQE